MTIYDHFRPCWTNILVETSIIDSKNDLIRHISNVIRGKLRWSACRIWCEARSAVCNLIRLINSTAWMGFQFIQFALMFYEWADPLPSGTWFRIQSPPPSLISMAFIAKSIKSFDWIDNKSNEWKKLKKVQIELILEINLCRKSIKLIDNKSTELKKIMSKLVQIWMKIEF